MQIRITLTDDEVRILERDILNVEEWVVNIIQAKLSTLCERIILQYSDKNPSKVVDKISEAKKYDFPPASSRNALPPRGIDET